MRSGGFQRKKMAATIIKVFSPGWNSPCNQALNNILRPKFVEVQGFLSLRTIVKILMTSCLLTSF